MSRPYQVVYFFREVLGVPIVEKALLCRRNQEYQNWVEVCTRNHDLPVLYLLGFTFPAKDECLYNFQTSIPSGNPPCWLK